MKRRTQEGLKSVELTGRCGSAIDCDVEAQNGGNVGEFDVRRRRANEHTGTRAAGVRVAVSERGDGSDPQLVLAFRQPTETELAALVGCRI